MIHTRIQRNEVGAINPESIDVLHLSITKDDSSITQFRELLNRALNCWPECPVDFKQLSDLLEHGKILQEYSDSKESSHTRIQSNDFYHGKEFELIKNSIIKYGAQEFIEYTRKSHSQSLKDWINEMEKKLADKPNLG
jgi:hypothetical protein